jgi:hypothetical protein
MADRYLPVNYRRGVMAGSSTLEAALRTSIDAVLDSGQRFSDAPAERTMVLAKGGHELLLNEFADVVDGVAGIICEVIPGSMQPVLKRIAQAKQLTTLTTANIFEIAETAAGEDTDFVQGLCYFYVRNNHVLFTTVKGFRKADVGSFFEWLLGRFGAGSLALEATLDKAEVGSDLGRVSKFRIKGSSSKGAGVALNVDGEVRRRAGAKTVAWSKAEDVVRTVLPEDAFDKLISSLSNKNHLVADVQWSVAGPRGKKVREAIQEVVTELADMDDGIVGIEAKGGVIKEGSVILETKRLFSVALEKTILIDFDHATDVLVDQYAAWVKDKKISA